MVWLFVVALLALAIFSRGFRAFVLVVMVILIVSGGIMYLVSESNSRAAKQRVSTSEVALEGATLGGDRLGLYHLRARVRNQSRYNVSRIDIVVTLRDCDLPGAKCDTVGQAKDLILADVPPGQVRDVDEVVFFSPAPVIRGRMEWTYGITSVVAD